MNLRMLSFRGVMGTLEFISALVKALAWPTAAVTVLVLFRRSFRALLPNLNRFRYKDLEVEFGTELAALKTQMESSAEPKSPSPTKDEEASDFYRAVGDASPRAAIVEAWIGLETAAVSSARALDLLPQGRPVSFPRLVAALRSQELVTRREAEVLGRLRTLRDAAAHDHKLDIGEAEVEEFIEVTRDVAENIASRTRQKIPKNC